MSKDSSSTLQSYIDSASGMAQSALGSLTGNSADKTQGEQTKDKAAAEKDLSHATAKAGPFNLSGSGAVTQDDPNRTEGSWNQTVGSAKESFGNMIGAEGLKQDGVRQNQEGKGQEAQGQLSDLGGGYADRAKGAIGSGFAGLTGDKVKQQEYQDKHDAGKTQQRSAEADIQRQAPR
ncbi:MAG: hypothetical protein M1827_004162 [Pycnora praestabilis]|nr:MAG: hypothetical protein M1827_004162 [Pycnora praestabilis]